MTQATQQLANHAATLAPLRQSAQQVQQAGDFDAILQFEQLQRDSQRFHVQIQQTYLKACINFDLNEARILQLALSLAHLTRMSLILNADLTATPAPFCKGLELKVSWRTFLLHATRCVWQLRADLM